ncbi:MAG: DMT family transporter [Pseudomonadota bacterium]
MTAGMFLFSGVDTMGKFLTGTLDPIQITWSRQLGLLLGVMFLLVRVGPTLLRSKHVGLQISRGALAAFSAVVFIYAVSFIPLADAVAISFVAPFIVTIMGAVILRERVGPRRWAAVIIGFLGTLIIIRPGFDALHPAAFAVIIAATAFAARQVISRMVAGADATRTTVAYTAIVSFALLSIPLPWVWQTPTAFEITLLAAMAVMAALAEVLVIMALDAAEAVVVAPMQYSLMIWGTMYGFLVFGQLPDIWTWIGALIIVATGLYMLNRERLAARRSPTLE